MIVGPVLAALLVAAGQPVKGRLVPEGVLEIAYRQKEDGQLSSSVHQVELFCYSVGCALTTITLNQCSDLAPGVRAFFPKVDRTSTEDGDLRILRSSPGEIVVEETLGATKLTHRFKYSSTPDLPMATLLDYNGVAVRDSPVLKKIVSWELVPFRGSRYVHVDAACKITLDGLPD
jgi:hypothetical protein